MIVELYTWSITEFAFLRSLPAHQLNEYNSLNPTVIKLLCSEVGLKGKIESVSLHLILVNSVLQVLTI